MAFPCFSFLVQLVKNTLAHLVLVHVPALHAVQLPLDQVRGPGVDVRSQMQGSSGLSRCLRRLERGVEALPDVARVEQLLVVKSRRALRGDAGAVRVGSGCPPDPGPPRRRLPPDPSEPPSPRAAAARASARLARAAHLVQPLDAEQRQE